MASNEKAAPLRSRLIAVLSAASLLALAAPTAPAHHAPGHEFLPDDRAWELVSPPDRHAGDVISNFLKTRPAMDGNAVTFSSLTGFGDLPGMGGTSEYLARRNGAPGTNGWTAHGLTPPQDPVGFAGNTSGSGPRYLGFAEDLSRAIFQAWSPLNEEDPNVADMVNLYRRDDVFEPGLGSFQLLTPCPLCVSPLPLANKHSRVPLLGGHSADLDRVIFHSPANLSLGATGSSRKLYEWAEGTLRLVGIRPDGTATSNASAGAGVTTGIPTSRAISADGSRISFTETAATTPPVAGPLFARVNGRATFRINASERAVPDSTQPATYWTASAAGDRVFFTSKEALTDAAVADGNTKLYMWELAAHDETQSVEVDATGGTFTLSFNGKATAPIAFDASATAVQAALEALQGPAPLNAPVAAPGNVSVSGGPGSAGGGSPYEVTFIGDFAGANVSQLTANGAGLSGGAATATVVTTVPVENLTQLDVDNEPADGTGASALGVIGAGESGHDVYFVSAGQLVAGAPSIPSSGAGIYHWHAEGIDFVGTLKQWSGDGPRNVVDGTPPLLKAPQSWVTADGRSLLFVSSSGEGLLSAHGGVDYDHGASGCPGSGNLTGCPQVYVYQAEGEELQCASCNPAGGPAVARAEARYIPPSVGAVEVSVPYRSRPLSDDGRFAFFSTAEPLVTEDVNGKVDAYRFNTEVGDVQLLSSGTSAADSYFLDAGASGRDAFFTTRERLSAWDRNDEYDLYDARLGGGFPEPPPLLVPCLADACQGAQPAPPGDATPPSAGLHGPGNLEIQRRKPPRCGKNQRRVRRHGKVRCVRKHRDSARRDRDASADRRSYR